MTFDEYQDNHEIEVDDAPLKTVTSIKASMMKQCPELRRPSFEHDEAWMNYADSSQNSGQPKASQFIPVHRYPEFDFDAMDALYLQYAKNYAVAYNKAFNEYRKIHS